MTCVFQCFTHRHLGWKINVLDECDATEAEESRLDEVVVPFDQQGQESIQVHSRVAPDANFLDHRKKIQKIINTKTNYDGFSSVKGDSLSGERTEPMRNQPRPSRPEYELPMSKLQIQEVIQAVESLESKMKEELRRNTSLPSPKPQQYQVHEDLKETFLPELPVREDDEYVVELGKRPDNFMLPPSQQPLTLQTVLRPNGLNKPMGNMRPPFRRPIPPEIKLRRPNPSYPKGNNMGYPLPMPNNGHSGHGPQKKPQPPKHLHNRGPPNMNRPMPLGVTPMKNMPPLHHNKPMFNQIPQKQQTRLTNTPVQPIITGKPTTNAILQPQSQLLNLGQTDIIANHVVKSQITLPGVTDVVAQHSTPQIYFSKPGQIILGKPMDNPVPLDQQMIPTKHQGIKSSATIMPDLPQSTIHYLQGEIDHKGQSQSEIKSSDFIGESVLETSTLKTAVNTGFQPDSIVIESGFKPIIREPLMAAEDRITDAEDSGNNRREDTDVEEDYEESPQYINHQNHQYTPSEKMTETFEPMFIPSPPDHLLPTNDRTKEIFPSNHAREDRPHPVYVKTKEELNALFSKNNMEKDVPSDMVMESDRISPHYLPPDPKNKEYSQKLSNEKDQTSTYTTYDGKTISADILLSVPNIENIPKVYSAKLPSNTELLLKTPQFGPFNGEIPPLVGTPSTSDLTKDQLPVSTDTQSTHLKLVSSHQESETEKDDLEAEGNEQSEVKEKADDTINEDEYENDDEDEDEERSLRRKRETKTTQFERGEVQEQIITNGHSIQHTGSQVEFETQRPTAAPSSSVAPYFTAQLVILSLCLRLF